MATKTINLRDVPEDLVRRAKAYAALRGVSLKDFILDAVRQVLDTAGGQFAYSAFLSPFKGERKGKRRQAKKRTTEGH